MFVSQGVVARKSATPSFGAGAAAHGGSHQSHKKRGALGVRAALKTQASLAVRVPKRVGSSTEKLSFASRAARKSERTTRKGEDNKSLLHVCFAVGGSKQAGTEKLVGVDVGGTFTDVVYTDTATGITLTHKVPTTPDNPSRGVLNGVIELCER